MKKDTPTEQTVLLFHRLHFKFDPLTLHFTKFWPLSGPLPQIKYLIDKSTFTLFCSPHDFKRQKLSWPKFRNFDLPSIKLLVH